MNTLAGTLMRHVDRHASRWGASRSALAPAARNAWRRALAAVMACTLAGCVSVGIGNEPVAHQQLRLVDGSAAAVMPRTTPLVPTLLVQPQPADAVADTLAIAYSREPQNFAFYQHASWTERPVRRVTRLLQERLQARVVAAAVGQTGDPLASDWLLALRVDTLHHDAATSPGQAQVRIVAELFDRRTRQRVAQRSFAAMAPLASVGAAAAAAAMSQALGSVFDELVPWLESALAARVEPR